MSRKGDKGKAKQKRKSPNQDESEENNSRFTKK